jgi:hypothetical protein
MEENLNQSNNTPLLFICLIEVNKVPEDDLRKIETCRSFDGFCGKIYIILTSSAFVSITQRIVYRCTAMNNITTA